MNTKIRSTHQTPFLQLPLQATQNMIERQPAFSGCLTLPLPIPPISPRPWACIGGLLSALLEPWVKAELEAPFDWDERPPEEGEMEEGEEDWFAPGCCACCCCCCCCRW